MATNIHLKSSSILKYIGARAKVTRTEEGVKITLTDYQGTTEEIIAEAIESITTNADGSLTFTLPNGQEITTDSLEGPQGIQGEKGDTGDAAGFGSVLATVDAYVGTPSVSVTSSGEDTAKNFTFEFHNLKGETGDSGVYVGSSEPTNPSKVIWVDPDSDPGVLKLKDDDTWVSYGMPTETQTVQAVSDWLDAHPEATTTVQDGAITEEKFSSGLDTMLLKNPVNVLSLGVDNTGETDCSEILNSYTGTAPLLFPIGDYLLNETFKPKVSIIGYGYGRGHGQGGTFFIQGSGSVDPVIEYENDGLLSRDIYIKDCGIKMSYDADGLVLNTRGDAHSYTIDGFSVLGLKNGTGIDVINELLTTATRSVYMSNIFILGAGVNYSSKGIHMHYYNGDSRLDTLEIMACRIGLWLGSGFHNVSFAHIWCGGTSSLPADTGASDTCCLRVAAAAKVNIDELYTDTAKLPIYLAGDRNILNVNNWIHWDDESLDDYLISVTDRELIYAGEYYNSVNITNMLVKCPNYMTRFSSNRVSINVSGGIRIFNKYYASTATASYRFNQIRLRSYHYTFDTPSTTTYIPIAYIHPSYSGTIKLFVQSYTGFLDEVTITYTTGSNLTISSINATRTGASTAWKLYYKVIGNGVLLYVKATPQSFSQMQFYVSAQNLASEFVMLNPATEIFYTGGYPFEKQFQTADVSELTAVTYS